MSTQVLSEQGFQAWLGLLRGHAALVRKLNAELIADHGITINDYDVMAQLMRAPERRMRRVDLAEGCNHVLSQAVGDVVAVSIGTQV